jgi:Flp pilus assembly protein TadG
MIMEFMRRRTRRRGERGAAAVEFALVVIPLLYILAAIVNFGFAFAQQLALDNAIRQAARAGVVDTGLNVTTVAQDEFTQSAVGTSTAPTVGFGAISTCENSTFGQSLEVQGDITVDFLFPWLLPTNTVPDSIDLHSEAEFQCEYS